MLFKKCFSILVFILLTVSLLVLSVLLYVKYLWPNTDFEQLIITLHDLTPDVIRTNVFLSDYFFGLLFFIITWPLAGVKLNLKQQFLSTVFALLAIIYLSGAGIYFYAIQTPSQLYEQEYVEPNEKEIILPQKKRNLVLIFLESFEQNFQYAQYYDDNLIKNLSALQKTGNHAKNYHSLGGTNYSIAALVSAHCGIPLRYRNERTIWENKYFLPQAICFPEILHQHGYQTKIIKAADIDYSQTRLFAKAHGYDEAMGIYELQTKYPELQQKQYQGTFGGLNDRTLFEYAKKELAEFAPDKPFMLTLFSLDTHSPTSYQDKNCPTKFNDLRDAVMCTDSIVQKFLEWFEQSPYYDNTTVVILGDHLLPVRIKTNGHPVRSTYNAFLNYPQGLSIDAKRHYSTLDIPATILESLNIKLKSHGFGLGRSLFSKEKTLAEKISADLNLQLIKPSEIYNKFITPLETHQAFYAPYTLGTIIQGSDFKKYTDAYEEIISSIYLDNLGFKLSSAPKGNIKAHLEFNAILGGERLITIHANQQEILRYTPKKNEAIPYKIDFIIPKSVVKDNQLLLTIRNHKGNVCATEMGIMPIILQLSEE